LGSRAGGSKRPPIQRRLHIALLEKTAGGRFHTAARILNFMDKKYLLPIGDAHVATMQILDRARITESRTELAKLAATLDPECEAHCLALEHLSRADDGLAALESKLGEIHSAITAAHLALENPGEEKGELSWA